MVRGEFHLGLGALLLTFANIVGIQVAGSTVMWLSGYRGENVPFAGSVLRRSVPSVVVFCVLAVLLSLNLRRSILDDVYEASVRKVLRAAEVENKGAHLTEVRFQRDCGRAVVVAVYRTPAPFRPEDARAIEPRLPWRSGDRSLELRIRSVPVTVASKDGYLYSNEDLIEFVSAVRR